MQHLADQIHAASLAILAEPGIRLHDRMVVEALRQGGLEVDNDTVHFDEDFVMAALARAPSTFSLKATAYRGEIEIGGNSRLMAPAYGAPTITATNRLNRPARWADYLRIARLVQASDLLHLNGGILVQPSELAPEWSTLAMMYAALCLSDKPLLGIQGNEVQVRRLMALGALACGGEIRFRQSPHFLFLVSTLSPLQIEAEALATLRVCAEFGQPVIITPGLMFGSTGPITPAGSMVQANAEFLAGLCVAQSLNPGLPVVYGCLGSPADLRTGGLSLGSPSRFAFKQLATAMAEKYHLPNRGIGAVTDAGAVSVQSGYEAMQTLNSDYRHRTSIVLHAAGILRRFACFSFEQFMVDLEIIRMLNAETEGPLVDTAALAVDLIREVGPGGEYLTHTHTLNHCRSLLFQPKLSPPRDGDPGALDDLIATSLAELENSFRAPEMDAGVQATMDAYLSACGVPSDLVEKVRQAAASA